MKLLHISDLHIGKRLMEVSLLEDQKYIVDQILSIIDDERPDAVLIAGDIYDRANPNAEAMELLDELLVQLAQRKASVMIISGNHDSPERLSYARRFLSTAEFIFRRYMTAILSRLRFRTSTARWISG